MAKKLLIEHMTDEPEHKQVLLHFETLGSRVYNVALDLSATLTLLALGFLHTSMQVIVIGVTRVQVRHVQHAVVFAVTRSHLSLTWHIHYQLTLQQQATSLCEHHCVCCGRSKKA